MTDRRLTDDQLAAALRAHLPASARPEMRSAILARTENAPQQRAMPSILGRLTDADPMARRRAWLIAAALLVTIALSAAAAAGALRLWDRSDLHIGARGLLAFVRQGDLYLAEPDGSGAALVAHLDGSPLSEPTWSPDGRWIVVQTAEPAVLAFDVRAPALRRLATGYIGAWSPDGGSLAVTTTSGEIRIIAAETGDARSLIHLWESPRDGAEPMAWSPDGRWLTASGPAGLVRIDPFSGAIEAISSDAADCVDRFAWSPDSSRLALSCWRERGMPDRFWIAAADGSSSMEIIDPDGIPIDPSWSPDGSWIAYVSLNRTFRPDDLIIVRPDGSGRRRLVGDIGGIVGWSPDGATLAYTTCGQCGWKEVPAEEVAGLHQIGLEGGSDRSFTVPHDATSFGWATSVGDERGASVPASLPSAIATSLPETPPATALAAPPVQPDTSWGRLLFGVDLWDAAGNHDACIVAALHFPDDLSQVRAEAGAAPHVTPVPVGPGASPPPQPALDAECWVAVRWAPDGSGYTVSRPGTSSFQVFAADGSPRSGRIPLHGDGPMWSPDSAWISGQDCPSPGLCDGGYHLVRPDGTAVHDLPGRPAWSANGAVLTVAAPDGSLWIGPTDGTDLRDVGQFPMPGGWSPDGSAFVFVRDGEAWIAGADGSHVRNLTTAELVGVTRAWWSPDGKLIATLEGSTLWLQSPDGSLRHRVGTGFGEGGSFPEWTPVWSPDGSWLAVERAEDVTLIRIGEWRSVLVPNAHAPVWSPDGRHLAVMTTDAAGSYAGAVMNADGSGLRIVTDRVDTLSLIWAP